MANVRITNSKNKKEDISELVLYLHFAKSNIIKTQNNCMQFIENCDGCMYLMQL